VVFYTTGELPLPEGGAQALVDWVRAGGAFAGVHSATDTLHEFPAYGEMIGGIFDGHPWNQKVGVMVEDGAHPATAHFDERFEITDEIYQFRSFRRHPLRVLLSLEPSSVDMTKGKREDGDYALAWSRDWGEGRMFYSALGPREEVWRDERFQQLRLNGIDWAVKGQDLARPAPADATVLFDGADLAQWQHRGTDKDGAWKIIDGAMQVVAGTRDLVTRDVFGDGLYHVEFRTPYMPEASGQARGNSGVYLQNRYEIQILDGDKTKHGMGAVINETPAPYHAYKGNGKWNAYDITFRAARFGNGKRTEKAIVSMFFNGIKVHSTQTITQVWGGKFSGIDGGNDGGKGITDTPGGLKLHAEGHDVRYRNIWIEVLDLTEPDTDF